MDDKKIVGKPNSQRGEFDLEVDGTVYRFRTCSNAMILLEDELGERAVNVEGRFKNGRETLRDIRALMWALLQEYQPTMSVEAVGDLVDEIAKLGSEKVQSVLADVLSAGSPEPSESDPPKPGFRKAKKQTKKQRRLGGTGAGSTRSRAGKESSPTSSST